MPHLPRYAIIHDNSLFHVTWLCHNKAFLLKHDWAKKIYYDLLLKYKDLYKIQFYSYCLMSNHPHLLGHCQSKQLFSDFFRVVNSQFAKTYNKSMRRRGQVVMDRFKSPQIDSYEYLHKVMEYIDLNPCRARLVDHPKDYKWSSFHFYAFGKPDPLITPAPCYLSLADSDDQRQAEYRKMIMTVLEVEGLQKKNYSSVHFIGNPIWVAQKNAELKTEILRRLTKATTASAQAPP